MYLEGVPSSRLEEIVLKGIYRLSLLLLLVSGCRTPSSENPTKERIVGVKIYAYEGNKETLFSRWVDLGVNVVLVSESLDADPEFQRLARLHDVKRFVIFPVFFDPDALDAEPTLSAQDDQGNPAIEEWVRFVCPSRPSFRRKKVEEANRIVREHGPQGLSLDFIRHFVFWEKVFPDRTLGSLRNTCFDEHCVQRFQGETAVQFPTGLEGASNVARYIQANHLERWTNWKSGLITSMVEEIALEVRRLQPGIQVNVHTLPWRRDDFGGAVRIVGGQDMPALSTLADFLSPMTYHHMVKQTPDWIHSVVEDLSDQTGGQVLPSIQVSKLQPPSRGVLFWSWDELEKDPVKLAVVREICGI
jgi:hypothetical protein